jgi:methylated-DNA-[protein]-cysteine S-methyltransferase
MAHPSHAEYDAVVYIPSLNIRLGVHTRQDALSGLDFLPPKGSELKPASPLARRIVAELQRYFSNPQTRFSIPLYLSGTVFQRRVWQALRKLPAGRTAQYGELARQLGTGARAIGNACRANPIPIVVPCHRVLAAHGLGGYSGATQGSSLGIKRRLLEHESRA